MVADGHVFVPMLRLSKLTTEAPLFSIFVTPVTEFGVVHLLDAKER